MTASWKAAVFGQRLAAKQGSANSFCSHLLAAPPPGPAR
jgi:hypothetical protein